MTRSTRCGNGRVRSKPQDTLAAADDLTPVKARIALILDLLGA